jgi:hypothetical protein
MKLAITQMILGVLIVFFSCFIITEGYLTEFTVPYPEPVPEGVEPFIRVNVLPGPFTGLAISAPILLGLTVVGCGIAQLVKARRKPV